MIPTCSRLVFALPVTAVLSALCPVHGNDESASAVTEASPSARHAEVSLAAEEQDFLQAAAAFHVAGIACSNLAARQANSVAIDTMSQQLRREHSLSLAAVREIARSKRVTLAEKPSAAQEAALAALALVTGRTFDDGYRKLVIALQEQAIRVFFAAMRTARDRDVRAFADRNFGELRVLRASLGCSPIIVEEEVVIRLLPPAPSFAFRIPASDGSTDARLSTEYLPALAVASRKEAVCIAAAGSITGPASAVMAGAGARAPRWRAFGAPELIDPAAVAENAEEETVVDENGKVQRKRSGTASRSSTKKKTKPDAAAAPLPAVAEAPKRTFFLFGRRSPAQAPKSKGTLASGSGTTSARPSKPFRLFGP